MSVRSRTGRGSQCIAAIALFLVSVSLLAGSTASASQTPKVNNGLPVLKENLAFHNLLPQFIKTSGVIGNPAAIDFPPDTYYAADGVTPTGINVDLATELGEVLGIKIKFINVAFSGILAGLQSGRYPMAIASFTDTKAREAQVNFVDYLESGASIVVTPANAKKLTEVSELCGHSVGVVAGNVYVAEVETYSKACQVQGKAAITEDTYSDIASALTALVTGRVDAVFNDAVSSGYDSKLSHGAIETVGPVYDQAPFGIAIPKSDPKLQLAVVKSLQELISDGGYEAVLKKWDVVSSGVQRPTVNGAVY